MIFSLGPLFQDGMSRILRKNEHLSDVMKRMRFSTEIPSRVMQAQEAGIAGLKGVSLGFNVTGVTFFYNMNIDDIVFVSEKNPQTIYGEPEGPIGTTVSIMQVMPQSTTEAMVGQDFNQIAGMAPHLGTIIGHLKIARVANFEKRTDFILDDQPRRIRMTVDF